MSLIHTCELNDINALDYLNQLQLHAFEVMERPDRWMPWNYQDNVADADADGHLERVAPEAGATNATTCAT